MKVVKNSLFVLALEQLGAAQLRSLVDGPVAVVKGDDPVAAARGVEAARKICGAIRVRGGLCAGSVLSAERVEKLAAIPDRPVLLAQLAGCLVQPLQLVAGLLAALPRQFVASVEALRKKQQAEEGS